MAAIFYKYQQGDMFKLSTNATPEPILCDFFSVIQRSGSTLSTIITQVGVQLNDTLQFFLTFDDFISYYYFGKGLGNLTVEGLILQNCDFELVGLDHILEQVQLHRGKKIKFAWGEKFSFWGVLTSISFNKVSEPETMISFQAQFALIDNTMKTSTVESVC